VSMALVDRPIRNQHASATPMQLLAYLRKRNPALPESEAWAIVNAYRDLGALWGIDPAGAFSQAMLETNSFRFGGQVHPNQHNPAGIAATNDGTVGSAFATWEAGIAAHYQHLLAWCGDERGTHDPRRALVDQAAREQGYATTWRSLGGRWAVPGTDYGDGIERHWQRIRGEGGAVQFADVAQIIPPGANRPGTKLLGFHACVAHETDNESPDANAPMHYAYIATGDRSAKPSFHLCADSARSMQFLPVAPGVAEVGWHIGDGADQPDDEAFFTVGGEICVNDRAGFPAACRKMARSFAAVLTAHGLPVIDGQTLRQHGSYWSARNPAVHRGCPRHLQAGDWGVTWAQFVALVEAEWATLNAVAAQTTPPADAAERQALLAYGDAIPAAYRGALTREGVADLTAHGGSASERIAVYERLVAHRLHGTSNILLLALWDSLRAEKKIILYG
jgi:hypothetical protein